MAGKALRMYSDKDTQVMLSNTVLSLELSNFAHYILYYSCH